MLAPHTHVMSKPLVLSPLLPDPPILPSEVLLDFSSGWDIALHLKPKTEAFAQLSTAVSPVTVLLG